MGRGAHTFNSLFVDTPIILEDKKLKGRNIDLVAIRNEELLHRYLYYGLYTDKRSDAILDQLVIERHLSKRRLQDIFCENVDILRKMRENPPTIKELREKYPHLVWQ